MRGKGYKGTVREAYAQSVVGQTDAQELFNAAMAGTSLAARGSGVGGVSRIHGGAWGIRRGEQRG